MTRLISPLTLLISKCKLFKTKVVKLFVIEKFQRPLGILALIAAALILGSIPTAIKEAMEYFSPSVQLALRFLIGAVVLTPFVREFNLGLLRDGLILGLVTFVSFAGETIGLETISANRASFIFGLSVVFVTLFELVFRQRLSVRAILASALAFGGIGVMSWEGGETSLGNIWLVVAALCDAISVIVLEKFSPQYSAVALSAIRVWCVALLGLIWAAPEITTEFQVLTRHWGALHYLGIVATGLVSWLAVIGLRWIPAHEAAIFLALEPLFGGVIAFFLIGETFGIRGGIGALMVLSGIILVITRPQLKEDENMKLGQVEIKPS
jgi:drug/metabolite transporter (DMT)-like permease